MEDYGNNSVYARYNYSDLHLYQRFVPQVNVIERANYPVWAAVGLPGGLFSVIIWSSRPMRRGGSAAAAVYQACVGVVDFSFFVVHLFWYMYVAWMIPVLDNPGICEIFPLFNYAIQYLSPMLTVIYTVERYLAVCHPFRSQNCLIRASESGALKVIAIIGVICFSTASVQSFVFSYDGQMCNTRAQINDVTHIAKTLYTHWTFFTECLFFFCMPVTSLILNLLVLRVLRRTIRSKQKTMKNLSINGPHNGNGQTQPLNYSQPPVIDDNSKNVRSSTITLVCTSFYVVIAHLSVAVGVLIHNLLPSGNEFLTDEQIERDHQWRTYFAFAIIRTLIDSFAMTHYAVKFPIYLATSRQFRHEFVQLFGVNHCFRRDKEKHAISGDLIRKSRNAAYAPMGLGRRQTLKPSKSITTGSEVTQREDSTKSDRYTHVNSRPRPPLGLNRTVIGMNGERVPAR